jgi:hypothetical protein
MAVNDESPVYERRLRIAGRHAGPAVGNSLLHNRFMIPIFSGRTAISTLKKPGFRREPFGRILFSWRAELHRMFAFVTKMGAFGFRFPSPENVAA